MVITIKVHATQAYYGRTATIEIVNMHEATYRNVTTCAAILYTDKRLKGEWPGDAATGLYSDATLLADPGRKPHLPQ